MLLKLSKDLFSHVLQSFEYAGPGYGNGLKKRDTARVKELVHIFQRCYGRQVSFVVLDGTGEFIDVISLFRKVYPQVIEAFHICLHPLYLAVSHKHYSVNTLEDELSAGRIEYLAGHCIKMKPYLEAPDVTEGQRKKIEKEGPFGLGCQRYEFAFLVGVGLFIDILEVGCLSAEAGTIINYLAVDFT